MKDINFFNSYISKGKNRYNSRILLIILFMSIALLIVGYGVFNELRINKLSENMIKLQEIAENPERLEMVNNISIKEEELEGIKLEIENIRDLRVLIDKKNFINKKYIESIIRRKPEELFLASISISTESIGITGTSNNRLSIAEFGKGLETIENCESIFISKISKEGLAYKFILESKLIKGVEDETIEKEKEESEDEQEYDENTD